MRPAEADVTERPVPIMLRPSEVAAMLALSRSEVYRLIDRGAIPSVRIGRSVRVPRRWVEQQAAVA